jgi:putative ABC transport system permease protein
MIGELIKESAISLRANLLRSFLTILGIIIGVSAVVMMVASGQAVQRYIDSRLSLIGSNILIILPGSSTAGGIRGGLGTIPTLTLNDNKLIAEQSYVEASAPVVRTAGQVVYSANNWNTGILGVTPTYLPTIDRYAETGRNFIERDIRTGAAYAIVGTVVAKQLFGLRNPIGETMRIKNIPFKIIGLLNTAGQSLDGRDQDDLVITPLTTARQRLLGSTFRGSVNIIIVKAKKDFPIEEAQHKLNLLLRQTHHLRINQDDDFSVRNLTALLQTIRLIGVALSLLLAAIASISLLVGSIGIMNMMLVSVTERTREIGIRKAIGATDAAILGQFLIESTLISFLGSITGLLIGIICAKIIGNFINIEVPISLWMVLLAALIAFFVGIFSGLVPALKATRKNPSMALRYQ